MTSYSEYFKIIDEIRVSKGISVETLCEGIMSERTYYRYLISNKDIKFDKFVKLAKKLDMKAYDLVHYSIFFRHGDPGKTMFMYRFQVHHYDDIHEIYAMVKDYHDDNEHLDLLLSVYKKKYAYMFLNETYEDYLGYINDAFNDFKDVSFTNDSAALFYTLYLQEYPNTKEIDLDALVNHYGQCDIRIGVGFKMWGIDNLLSLLIEADKTNMAWFNILLKKMDSMMDYYNHKFFTMKHALYHAYVAFKENKIQEMEDQLLIYSMNLIILFGGDEYRSRVKLVEDTFSIDIEAITKKKSLEYLQTDQFEIVE
jgi:transcriptional regulator with XRE-family HTH domain